MEESWSVWLFVISGMRRVTIAFYCAGGEWAVHSLPTASWAEMSSGDEVISAPLPSPPVCK